MTVVEQKYDATAPKPSKTPQKQLQETSHSEEDEDDEMTLSHCRWKDLRDLLTYRQRWRKGLQNYTPCKPMARLDHKGVGLKIIIGAKNKYLGHRITF